MSLMLIKIIGSPILAIASFYIVKNLLNSNQKLLKINVLPLVLLMMLPTCFLFGTKYTTIVALLTYIIEIFIYKKIFKLTISSSVIVCGFVMVLVSISDGLLSLIEVCLITYEQARTVWYIILINNILVSLIALSLSYLKIFRSAFEFINKKINTRQKIMSMIFAVLMVAIVAILHINISGIFKLNLYYSVTVGSVIIFFLLYYFYMDERNNYEKLHEEYSTVFDYVQNFENWIDDEQMYRHELKNNLSIIRGMTKEKKVIKKVDDMLGAAIIVDDEYIEQLKNIPKGGLKGLLYYKIAIASNNKVNMITEVSPKVTERIEDLSESKLRQICILLGIYLDNAIESSRESEKKIVTLEVYLSKNRLNFVISNTYENDIPLEEIKKKGYSTKGEGRGKGLHYAEKVVNKNKDLDADNIILNNFYIQTFSVN